MELRVLRGAPLMETESFMAFGATDGMMLGLNMFAVLLVLQGPVTMGMSLSIMFASGLFVTK